jgi:hypothetical protein
MTDAYRSKPNIDTEVKAWKRAKKHVIPIMNQLAVQLLPASEENKRLIELPDSLKDKGIMESQRFLVIAAGPDCKQVKEGNVIVGLTGVPMNSPPGIIHKGEQLAVIIETQCLTMECDEQGNAVVMLDEPATGFLCSCVNGNNVCVFKANHVGPHQDNKGNRWSD